MARRGAPDTEQAGRRSWDLTPQEARAVQEELRGRVVAEDRFGEIDTVAGVDVGFSRRGKEARARAAVVVLGRETRWPTETYTGRTPIDLTLAVAPRYRLPETTRRAHRLASG